jgi:hypothetical protein
MLNADLKKSVLSCFLKVDETVCSRRSAGSAFQAAGPAYEKERSPNLIRAQSWYDVICRRGGPQAFTPRSGGRR